MGRIVRLKFIQTEGEIAMEIEELRLFTDLVSRVLTSKEGLK